MRATINSDHADDTFKKLQNLVSEGLLRFTENGLKLTTADPAMVAMIDLSIPADSFIEYEVNPDEEHQDLQEEGEEGILVGVNIENLYSVMKLFDDEITLSIEENDLILEEGTDRFELPILNLSTDDIPSMDELNNFKLEGRLEKSDLKTLRKKLAVASDSTTLTLTEDGELEAEGGGDQISIESSVEVEDVEPVEEDCEETRSMFALEYLSKGQKMFSNLDTADEVAVKMGEDFPLKMVHESDRETLTFVLAPRIEEQ